MKVVARIFGYLRPYWRRVVLVYVALFAALGLQLTIPLVLARAIDDGIVGGDRGFLLQAAALIVGLTVVQGLFTYLRSYRV